MQAARAMEEGQEVVEAVETAREGTEETASVEEEPWGRVDWVAAARALARLGEVESQAAVAAPTAVGREGAEGRRHSTVCASRSPIPLARLSVTRTRGWAGSAVHRRLRVRWLGRCTEGGPRRM